ncbi:hypothetical protein [uncultured Aquimarina sp.]|uniref:hypothetical protein n=1 Tax=uncultured Aquimarina sp. TaxID=575652 RepID=UPI0026030AF0|nr:hypothetical protein [uncultured Aquimarina sp.]
MTTRNFTITKQVIKEKREPKVLKFGGKVILGSIVDIYEGNIVTNVKQFFAGKSKVKTLSFHCIKRHFGGKHNNRIL